MYHFPFLIQKVLSKNIEHIIPTIFRYLFSTNTYSIFMNTKKPPSNSCVLKPKAVIDKYVLRRKSSTKPTNKSLRHALMQLSNSWKFSSNLIINC